MLNTAIIFTVLFIAINVFLIGMLRAIYLKIGIARIIGFIIFIFVLFIGQAYLVVQLYVIHFSINNTFLEGFGEVAVLFLSFIIDGIVLIVLSTIKSRIEKSQS